MLLLYWHILHLNCCTTTTSIMASRLCRSSSSVPEAGGGCTRELGSPWGSSGGSRHVDVDVGPSARVSMAARLLVRVEVDIGDVMGAPEDRTENGRQDCLRVSAALPRQAQIPHEARAMANPLGSHRDLSALIYYRVPWEWQQSSYHHLGPAGSDTGWFLLLLLQHWSQ